MCTLLVWKGVHPDHPVIVAANRDEDERRPSARPQVIETAPRIVGGVDLVAGGTWLAISEFGHLVALTNRRGAGKHDPAKASRGKLVLDITRSRDLGEMESKLRAIDARRYNPFVLVALDANGGLVAQGGEAGLDLTSVADGVHAVTNWDFDSQRDEKARRALRLGREFPVHQLPGEALAPALHELLKDHASGPNGNDGGLCVHRPDVHYGTRSSAIVLFGSNPRAMRYFFVDGHPCEGMLEDMTSLPANP
jgi:uncharacterized protein with NRDE domain